MSGTPIRLVVVTYDAATGGFSMNPDPIRIPAGETALHYALQTANRGDAPQADFVAIFEDHQFATASAVDGSPHLWRVDIDNEPAPAADDFYNYTVRIRYAGSEHVHDPTVILEPDPPDPSGGG